MYTQKKFVGYRGVNYPETQPRGNYPLGEGKFYPFARGKFPLADQGVNYPPLAGILPLVLGVFYPTTGPVPWGFYPGGCGVITSNHGAFDPTIYKPRPRTKIFACYPTITPQYPSTPQGYFLPHNPRRHFFFTTRPRRQQKLGFKTDISARRVLGYLPHI